MYCIHPVIHPVDLFKKLWTTNPTHPHATAHHHSTLPAVVHTMQYGYQRLLSRLTTRYRYCTYSTGTY